MSLSRTYDTIIKVDNAYGFYNGMVIVGNTTGTIGIIANVNFDTGNLKLRISNSLQEFVIGESIHANITQLMGGPLTNSIYFSNSVPTIVNGNSYIIDGNTRVFPLPSNYKPIFFDVINIKADGVIVPQNAYVWPAANLNEYGVEFLPRNVSGEIPDEYEVRTNTGNTVPRSQMYPNQRDSKR